MSDVVLIYPPVSLPCEPPIGIATLATQLRAHGIGVTIIDANIEALTYLLDSVPERAACTTAQRRALRGRARALQDLRSTWGYSNLDRYRKAVKDVSQVLRLVNAGTSSGINVGLADYQDDQLSPISSADLAAASQLVHRSPFLPYYTVLADRIAERPPRLIGLSVSYLHQALPALTLAGVLRQRLKKAKLLIGGALFRCWQGRIQTTTLIPPFDTIHLGSGVSALLAELGVARSSTEEHIVAPDYADMPWNLYLSPTRIAPVSTSRGCYWRRCRYCPEAITETSCFALPGPQVLLWIDEVRRQTQAELLHLTDSAIPTQTLRFMAHQVWSTRWYGFARFQPDLAQKDFCHRLHRSGCVMLQLGLESGSERILHHLRKGINLDLASAVLRQLAETGIIVYLYVMFGIPGETREDALQTLEFVAAHASYITYVNTSLLNVPRQTLLEPGLIHQELGDEQGDLSLYVTFRGTGAWDRRAARHFLEREFSRHPEVAPILRRAPPVFGASHAPFFK